MKINDIRELRVGNWVTRKNVPNEFLKVLAIDSIKNTVYLDLDGIGVIEKFENLESIPLTQDIIKKIVGIFSSEEIIDYPHKPSYEYIFDGKYFLFDFNYNISKKEYEVSFNFFDVCDEYNALVMSLNELQNWFYLYTKKELEIEF